MIVYRVIYDIIVYTIDSDSSGQQLHGFGRFSRDLVSFGVSDAYA